MDLRSIIESKESDYLKFLNSDRYTIAEFKYIKLNGIDDVSIPLSAHKSRISPII